MDIDVVLVDSTGARSPRKAMLREALYVRFALEMVEAIKAKIGAGGRIGRLRIFDDTQLAGAGSHPLAHTAQLARLAGLFEAGGSVEVVSPRLTATGSTPTTAASGTRGISIPGVGAAPIRSQWQHLSGLLGVPVRLLSREK